MRDDMLLVLAFDGDRPVAGALNFIGRDTLLRPLLGLHRGSPLPAFRTVLLSGDRLGDRPRPCTGSRPGRRANTSWRAAICRSRCHSLHWIADPGFPRRRLTRYLQAERRAVGEEIEVLTAYGPFRKREAQE